MPTDVHGAVETLLILLLVIVVVALLVQRIHLPYTVVLVFVGLVGFRPDFRAIELSPDLILVVFLPVLLFEGAYDVSAKRLWREIVPITLLAVPGVLIGTLVTGAILRLALGLPWVLGILFGALIASTDPIAVIALFREMRAPRRLTLLVEGESLFNDGAAITLFSAVLAVALTGEARLGEGVGRFVLTVVGALVVGVVIGYGGSYLLRLSNSSQLQITLTLVAAYGSYLLAEASTFSGAIAVVVTALLFGNYGATAGVTSQTVRALASTWEFLGFIANSLIFLLIGIELDFFTLARDWWAILLAFAATLVGRAVVIYVALPLVRGRRAVPPRFLPVIWWGGLRGAVSLALALSIPLTLASGSPFPYRELLLHMAFGVVGLSLLIQGLTMGPLLRSLGLSGANAGVDGDDSAGDLALQRMQTRVQAIEQVLVALADERPAGHGVEPGLNYERLVRAYQYERDQLEEDIRQLRRDQADREGDLVAEGGADGASDASGHESRRESNHDADAPDRLERAE